MWYRKINTLDERKKSIEWKETMKTKADSPKLRTATTMCSKGTRSTAHAQYNNKLWSHGLPKQWNHTYLPEAVSSFCEENSDKMGKLDLFLSKFRIGSLLSPSFSFIPPSSISLSLSLQLYQLLTRSSLRLLSPFWRSLPCKCSKRSWLLRVRWPSWVASLAHGSSSSC